MFEGEMLLLANLLDYWDLDCLPAAAVASRPSYCHDRLDRVLGSAMLIVIGRGPPYRDVRPWPPRPIGGLVAGHAASDLLDLGCCCSDLHFGAKWVIASHLNFCFRSSETHQQWWVRLHLGLLPFDEGESGTIVDSWVCQIFSANRGRLLVGSLPDLLCSPDGCTVMIEDDVATDCEASFPMSFALLSLAMG
ncbi:hypothetical protein ACLOJK_010143 [Asimina triloba]